VSLALPERRLATTESWAPDALSAASFYAKLDARTGNGENHGEPSFAREAD